MPSVAVKVSMMDSEVLYEVTVICHKISRRTVIGAQWDRNEIYSWCQRFKRMWWLFCNSPPSMLNKSLYCLSYRVYWFIDGSIHLHSFFLFSLLIHIRYGSVEKTRIKGFTVCKLFPSISLTPMLIHSTDQHEIVWINTGITDMDGNNLQTRYRFLAWLFFHCLMEKIFVLKHWVGQISKPLHGFCTPSDNIKNIYFLKPCCLSLSEKYNFSQLVSLQLWKNKPKWRTITARREW